jgi:hypothetical protein
MLQRSPKQLSAVAIHEAAFIVAARVLNVPMRPPPARLVSVRRYGCDVCDLGARDVYDLDAVAADADTLDKAAVVMMSGLAALNRIGADTDICRDLCGAQDLAGAAQAKRLGGYEVLATFSWHYREQSSAVQEREFSAPAKELVEKNWAEIEAEAERLLAQPRRSSRKRALTPPLRS